MWKAVCATLALLAVFSGTTPAAVDKSMDGFVAEVLRKNPSLRARALGRESFSREATASGLWPDPEAAVMFDNLGARDPEMPMVRYQISQMVPWPGKLGFMQRAAELRTDAASADWKIRRLELELDAKRAFLMLALKARRRDVNHASRGLVKTIADAALARYSAGMAGHHDVSRAAVELNAVDVEAIALSGERVSIVSSLSAYSTGTVEITGLLDAWRGLLAAEIARAEAGIQLAEAVAQLERAIGAPLETVLR